MKKRSWDESQSYSTVFKRPSANSTPPNALDDDEFSMDDIDDGALLEAFNQLESLDGFGSASNASFKAGAGQNNRVNTPKINNLQNPDEEIEDAKLVAAMLAMEGVDDSGDEFQFDPIDAGVIDVVERSASQYFQSIENKSSSVDSVSNLPSASYSQLPSNSFSRGNNSQLPISSSFSRGNNSQLPTNTSHLPVSYSQLPSNSSYSYARIVSQVPIQPLGPMNIQPFITPLKQHYLSGMQENNTSKINIQEQKHSFAKPKQALHSTSSSSTIQHPRPQQVNKHPLMRQPVANDSQLKAEMLLLRQQNESQSGELSLIRSKLSTLQSANADLNTRLHTQTSVQSEHLRSTKADMERKERDMEVKIQFMEQETVRLRIQIKRNDSSTVETLPKRRAEVCGRNGGSYPNMNSFREMPKKQAVRLVSEHVSIGVDTVDLKGFDVEEKAIYEVKALESHAFMLRIMVDPLTAPRLDLSDRELLQFHQSKVMPVCSDVWTAGTIETLISNILNEFKSVLDHCVCYF